MLDWIWNFYVTQTEAYKTLGIEECTQLWTIYLGGAGVVLTIATLSHFYHSFIKFKYSDSSISLLKAVMFFSYYFFIFSCIIITLGDYNICIGAPFQGWRPALSRNLDVIVFAFDNLLRAVVIGDLIEISGVQISEYSDRAFSGWQKLGIVAVRAHFSLYTLTIISNYISNLSVVKKHRADLEFQFEADAHFAEERRQKWKKRRQQLLQLVGISKMEFEEPIESHEQIKFHNFNQARNLNVTVQTKPRH